MKADKQEVDNMAEQLKPIELPPLPEKPLVSVLVANYNYAKYVGEAIESVLRQTYQNFEVVVCDDGSTDNSREVVEGYAARDPRVKLIAKENGGLASTLNTAFAACHGEVVCLLDADDLYLPPKIESVVESFKAHPNAGMCTHWWLNVNGTCSDAKSLPIPVPLGTGWLGWVALTHGGFSGALPPQSGLSFRRETADCVFPMPVHLRRITDKYLPYAAQFLTEACVVREPLAKYRIHGGNMTAGTGQRGVTDAFKRYLGDLGAVTNAVQEFLACNFGREVAEVFRLEDNPLYWRYRFAVQILGNRETDEDRELNEVVLRMRPRRVRAVARLLSFLPRSLAQRVFLFGWDPLRGRSSVVFAVRTALRM